MSDSGSEPILLLLHMLIFNIRFQYWHYMKLMMVAFLVMPNFGRSAYVYNHFIKSCIYMNPQAVISRFRSWKNIVGKKEDFKIQAEKYIAQNGTEALEDD